jgi:glycosyltransferase involved in cell wall biosynthesis
VSVVITNHNYASYIEGCVESVCRSNAAELPGGVELVVVDDASTDDSLARIRRQMATLGWPLLLAAKPERTGPGDSRNIGLARARAAYAFMLDADNEVSPHCLARLYRALHGGHHAASYGICAKVDGVTDEARGLLSPYAWSVERLVRGPYIDGMALFDRETLLSLGGYAADLVEGWEDYDLWLRLAEAGHSALHVPQIVARYRTHRFGSVSHRAARHHPELHRHFNDRFAALARRFPEAGERFGFPCRQLPVARKAYAAYRRLRDALARFGS